MSKVNFVRDDDSDRLFGLGTGVNADVPNEITGFVYSFKTFESDVLIENVISECRIESNEVFTYFTIG